MKKVEAKKEGGRVVIGRPTDDKRLQELATKKGKSQAELMEELLLRTRRIEEHLGIK